MEPGDKIAIVGCSNGRPPESREAIRQLKNVLEEMGLRPVFGEYLYAGRSVVSGTGAQRAGALMDFYRDPEIKAIFDISGGDVAKDVYKRQGSTRRRQRCLICCSRRRIL